MGTQHRCHRGQSEQLFFDEGGGLLESGNWSARLSKRTECLSWVSENELFTSPGETGKALQLRGHMCKDKRSEITQHTQGANMTSFDWERGYM